MSYWWLQAAQLACLIALYSVLFMGLNMRFLSWQNLAVVMIVSLYGLLNVWEGRLR